MILLILLIVIGTIALVALFQVFIPGPTEYQQDAWPNRGQAEVHLTENEEPPP